MVICALREKKQVLLAGRKKYLNYLSFGYEILTNERAENLQDFFQINLHDK